MASNRGAVHDVQSDGGDRQEGEGEAAGQEEEVLEQQVHHLPGVEGEQEEFLVRDEDPCL